MHTYIDTKFGHSFKGFTDIWKAIFFFFFLLKNKNKTEEINLGKYKGVNKQAQTKRDTLIY